MRDDGRIKGPDVVPQQLNPSQLFFGRQVPEPGQVAARRKASREAAHSLSRRCINKFIPVAREAVPRIGKHIVSKIDVEQSA